MKDKHAEGGEKGKEDAEEGEKGKEDPVPLKWVLKC